MKKALIVIGITLLIGMLSFLLSGVVRDILILPVVKFFWVLRGYYGSISQAIIWGLVTFGVAIIAIFSLRNGKIGFFSLTDKSNKTLGEVSQLAFWIKRQKQGPYPRWFVARTLADLAYDLLLMRGSNIERGDPMIGGDFHPSEEIRVYLETAMRSTPANFPRQMEGSQIPNDPEIETVIDYLESYAENNND